MSVSISSALPGRIGTSRRLLAPAVARLLYGAGLAAFATAGAVATGSQETLHLVAREGADWALMLRFMAGLKALMAVTAAGAVVWRLGSTAPPGWLAAYGLAGMAMAAGPGLIWGLAHIGSGAFLLHAGLAATLLLLWRDPEIGFRLAGIVAARRAAWRSPAQQRT